MTKNVPRGTTCDIKTRSKARGRGRPSGLDRINPKFLDRLLDEIALGVPKTIACKAQGISVDTFEDWLRKRDDLSAKLAAKKAARVKGLLGRLDLAPWQGAAWMLERIYKDHFTAPTANGNDVSVTVNNAVVGLDPAKLAIERQLLNSQQRIGDKEELNLSDERS